MPIEEIQEGIRHGVRKVNIDTDIRLAMTGALAARSPRIEARLDPRKFLLAATPAARGICRERFEQFGCAGQADRLKPVALERMATRYATAA